MDRPLLIRNAEVGGRRTDLRCDGGRIVELAGCLDPHPNEEELDAQGGALLPGLHDHHIHLLSLAAQFESIRCGPPQIETRSELVEVLRGAEPVEGWLRGTGYFESVAGPLDRIQMDALCDRAPLRIQHRSGAMWFLNSRAIETLGLDKADTPDGVERDAKGRATGRLFRADTWLRDRLPRSTMPDLARVGSFLARCGVTRLTDATPSNGKTEAALFRAAQESGALPQRLRLMGGMSLSEEDAGENLEIAEVKIMLDEPALPEFDDLVARMVEAHRDGRCVAIHTVTRTEIHFAMAALAAAGVLRGDRLEHASVAPDEVIEEARRLGIAIVTQPHFLAERGDAYRVDVETRDLEALYRVRSWLDAGVPLGAGTDAPFGDPDPWRAAQAAVTRTTASGAILGKSEAVSPEAAIALFSDEISASRPDSPPGAGLAVGQPADLCILNVPWREARHRLSKEFVAATICDGQLIWSAPG